MKIISHLSALVAAFALAGICASAWAGKSTRECESEIGIVADAARERLLIQCLLGSPSHVDVRTQDEKVEWTKREEELVKQEPADRLKQVSQALRKLSHYAFCGAFGVSLRGGEVYYDFGTHRGAEHLFKMEAARRKLTFNSSLILSEKIKIGMSECELYASWGYPKNRNRTVGSWGVHIQHVYDATYVYTKNGRIDSLQD